LRLCRPPPSSLSPLPLPPSPSSQEAKVNLKPLIVAVMPIYCHSEMINLFFFLFLCVLNKLIILSIS
jgi:hypothetical protein